MTSTILRKAGLSLLTLFLLSPLLVGQLAKKPPVPKKTYNYWILIELSPNDFTRTQEVLGKAKPKKVGTRKTGQLLVLTQKHLLSKLKKAGITWRGETRNVPYKYRLPNFESRRSGRLPVKNNRLYTNDGYHDHAMVARLLQGFAKRYPHISRLHTLGQSWQGRPILALKISTNPTREKNKPAVLFNGAHHGSELLSTEFVLDTIEYLLHNFNSSRRVHQWVERFEIWCVPLVNPDGNHRFMHVCGTGRKNGRDTIANGKIDRGDGVDLNRNYPFMWHSLAGRKKMPAKASKGKKRPPSSGTPHHGNYRGPSPGSEPETQAMMTLAANQCFIAAISYHTAATKILVPFTIDNLKNPEPNVAWKIGQEMAQRSDSCRPDRAYLAVRNLYSVDGVDQDWLYFEFGTLAYIIEGPKTNPPYKANRNRMVRGIRPAWFHLLDTLLKGPTVSGHLRDRNTGKPLAGQVAVEEIRTFAGERHPTHSQTGRFDQVLPGPGTYHLVFRVPGYRDKKVKINIGRQWKRIRVEMERKP